MVGAMAAKVTVENLHKRYGQVEAVRGVTFAVDHGEIFGLIGPNGAGKTTTVECVLGLREPDAGRIEICGLDARIRPHAVKARIGAALQTTALQDKITPREALRLYAAFYPAPTEPAALLERFALADKADVAFDTLSGGQRQRLALALAFVNAPDVVFLDEPTSGLDPQARRELHQVIARMKADGHTVLLTTHYLDEAEALCDRVAIIDHGVVIASGAPSDLMARSSAVQRLTVTATGPVDLEALRGLEAVTDVAGTVRQAVLQTDDASRTLTALLGWLAAHGLGISELHVHKASLEDVFIEMTGEALRD